MITINKEIAEKLVKRFNNLITDIVYNQKDNSYTIILDFCNADKEIVLCFAYYIGALKDFGIIDDNLYENIEIEIYNYISYDVKRNIKNLYK